MVLIKTARSTSGAVASTKVPARSWSGANKKPVAPELWGDFFPLTPLIVSGEVEKGVAVGAGGGYMGFSWGVGTRPAKRPQGALDSPGRLAPVRPCEKCPRVISR